jgi:hypothetical protein
MDVAQSCFDGTWQMKMDTLEFSGPSEDYLFVDGMYHCKSCIPKVDVKTDGVDYPVVGYNYDTLAAQILDDRAIKFTMKKAGRLYFECIETVSPDGQKMMGGLHKQNGGRNGHREGRLHQTWERTCWLACAFWTVANGHGQERNSRWYASDFSDHRWLNEDFLMAVQAMRSGLMEKTTPIPETSIQPPL